MRLARYDSLNSSVFAQKKQAAELVHAHNLARQRLRARARYLHEASAQKGALVIFGNTRGKAFGKPALIDSVQFGQNGLCHGIYARAPVAYEAETQVG